MLSLPAPLPTTGTTGPQTDWADIEARMSRAIMHLHAALTDLKATAQLYDGVFMYPARPSDSELRARRAWADSCLIRDQARARLRERQRETDRAAKLPVWMLNKEIADLDTMRLHPRLLHPPEHAIERAPHQTGRMRIFEEPSAS